MVNSEIDLLGSMTRKRDLHPDSQLPSKKRKASVSSRSSASGGDQDDARDAKHLPALAVAPPPPLPPPRPVGDDDDDENDVGVDQFGETDKLNASEAAAHTSAEEEATSTVARTQAEVQLCGSVLEPASPSNRASNHSKSSICPSRLPSKKRKGSYESHYASSSTNSTTQVNQQPLGGVAGGEAKTGDDLCIAVHRIRKNSTESNNSNGSNKKRKFSLDLSLGHSSSPCSSSGARKQRTNSVSSLGGEDLTTTTAARRNFSQDSPLPELSPGLRKDSSLGGGSTSSPATATTTPRLPRFDEILAAAPAIPETLEGPLMRPLIPKKPQQQQQQQPPLSSVEDNNAETVGTSTKSDVVIVEEGKAGSTAEEERNNDNNDNVDNQHNLGESLVQHREGCNDTDTKTGSLEHNGSTKTERLPKSSDDDASFASSSQRMLLEAIMMSTTGAAVGGSDGCATTGSGETTAAAGTGPNQQVATAGGGLCGQHLGLSGIGGGGGGRDRLNSFGSALDANEWLGSSSRRERLESWSAMSDLSGALQQQQQRLEQQQHGGALSTGGGSNDGPPGDFTILMPPHEDGEATLPGVLQQNDSHLATDTAAAAAAPVPSRIGGGLTSTTTASRDQLNSLASASEGLVTRDRLNSSPSASEAFMTRDRLNSLATASEGLVTRRDRLNSLASASEASLTGLPMQVEGIDVTIDIQAFVSATVGDQLAEIAGAVELAGALDENAALRRDPEDEGNYGGKEGSLKVDGGGSSDVSHSSNAPSRHRRFRSLSVNSSGVLSVDQEALAVAVEAANAAAASLDLAGIGNKHSSFGSTASSVGDPPPPESGRGSSEPVVPTPTTKPVVKKKRSSRQKKKQPPQSASARRSNRRALPLAQRSHGGSDQMSVSDQQHGTYGGGKSSIDEKEEEELRERARAAAVSGRSHPLKKRVRNHSCSDSATTSSSSKPLKKRVQRTSTDEMDKKPSSTDCPASAPLSSFHVTPKRSNRIMAETEERPHVPLASTSAEPVISEAPATVASSAKASNDRANQKWESMFLHLIKFIDDRRARETEGLPEEEQDLWIWDGNVPTNHKTEDGKALGRWVNNQRTAKQKGSLRDDRIQKLEDAGLKWSVLSANSWNETLEELRLYVQEQTKDGSEWDGNVPTNYQIKYRPGAEFAGEDRNLGRWVNRQRSQHHAGKLRKDRQLALEQVGLKWSMLELTTWDTMYENLLRYIEERKEATGEWDGNVPTNYKTSDNPPKALGRWINRQRTSHIKKKLKKEYVDKLDRVGLKWSVHDRTTTCSSSSAAPTTRNNKNKNNTASSSKNKDCADGESVVSTGDKNNNNNNNNNEQDNNEQDKADEPDKDDETNELPPLPPPAILSSSASITDGTTNGNEHNNATSVLHILYI